MTNRLLVFLVMFFSASCFFSQELVEEDPSKMVREVVKLEVERAKFAPPPPVHTETKGKKGKKKQVEEPPAVPDTGNPLMPAPVGEVLKRAHGWFKTKNAKYAKSNGTNSGSSVSCKVEFDYKQKVFNTLYDVDGKITMEVLIEAKEGKYRYTIKNIKHLATKPELSGGDVYLTVPACGSTNIEAKLWTKIKAEALADAAIVADDLKSKMKLEADSKKDDW